MRIATGWLQSPLLHLAAVLAVLLAIGARAGPPDARTDRGHCRATCRPCSDRRGTSIPIAEALDHIAAIGPRDDDAR